MDVLQHLVAVRVPPAVAGPTAPVPIRPPAEARQVSSKDLERARKLVAVLLPPTPRTRTHVKVIGTVLGKKAGLAC